MDADSDSVCDLRPGRSKRSTKGKEPKLTKSRFEQVTIQQIFNNDKKNFHTHQHVDPLSKLSLQNYGPFNKSDLNNLRLL